MTDATFTCPQCSRTWPYDEADKTLDPDPRTRPTRLICYDCEDVYLETGKPYQPPYAGKLGSKGGGASADMAEQLKSKAGRDRMRIARWLAEFGAHGAEDVAQGLSLDADYVSPRLSELVTLGLAEKGPRTAVTRRGNPAHVYQLTDAGLSVATRKAAA